MESNMLNAGALRTAVADRLRPFTSGEPLVPKSKESEALADASPLDWRAVAKRAAGIWLVTRLAVVAVSYYAGAYFNGGRFGPVVHDSPVVGLDPRSYLYLWYHWDAIWYIRLANYGYAAYPSGAAFFPLYPLLIHLVTVVIGSQHALLAAMIISNLAALGAFIGLGMFAAQEAGLDAATRSIRLLAAYPLAFFLTAGYGDGLFIAFAVFALFFARRGKWWWAAGFALLAGFTRITAVILVLPLLWEYGRQHDWWRNGAWRAWLRQPRAIAELIALAVAVPVSIGIFVLYLWGLFGDLLIIPHMEARVWGHRDTWPWISLKLAVHDLRVTPFGSMAEAHMLFDLVPVLIFGTLTVLLLRRMPVAFSLYMIGLLGLSLVSPITSINNEPFLSFGRYLLAAIPMFLVLGIWARRPWLDTLLVATGFGVQAILLMQFFAHRWII
jgi:hypothetical protein